MIELDMADWRWCRTGEADPDRSFTMLERLTREGDRRGDVLHVADRANEYLLKVRDLPTLRNRFAASLGLSSIHNEARMMMAASSRALPVAPLVALCSQRASGLVIRQGLLVYWLKNRTTLRDRLTSGMRHDESEDIDAVRDHFVHCMARVRRAGLADTDFGLGNLLVPGHVEEIADPYWTDLEAAYRADPHDSDATCRTVAAGLVSWWVATGGHRASLDMTFAALRGALPEPSGGWPAVLGKLNRRLEQRMAKQVRHGRIHSVPEPLRLEYGGP